VNVKRVEKKEKNTADIAIEIAAEEFETAVNSAYVKSRGKISIPGFRRGKAPRKIIESMYGASVFYEDALDILAPQALEFARNESELQIVGRPSVSDVNFGEDKSVTITYAVSLYPEVTLGEYKGLAAAKPAVKVLKKEIDEEVENVRKRNARIVTVDRAAKEGDSVNIDYQGLLNGEPFDGGTDQGFNLVLGSGAFVPGFEDQVVGMSAGEEKDLDITFPENYAPELAGKAVVFKVKVNEVKESVLPELDDEFAKDVSEFDTLDEYKESVKKTISERKKNETEAAYKQEILNKLTAGMTCEIPEDMIEERIDTMVDNYNYSLQAQGIDFATYLQMMGMNYPDFRSSMRQSTEEQLKTELALEKVAEVENIEIPEADIEAEYAKLAEGYGIELEAAKSSVPVSSVTKQLKLDRAEALVMESAVVEAKKTTKKKAEEESAE